MNAARLQTLPEGLRGDTDLGRGAGHGELESVKEKAVLDTPPAMDTLMGSHRAAPRSGLVTTSQNTRGENQRPHLEKDRVERDPRPPRRGLGGPRAR